MVVSRNPNQRVAHLSLLLGYMGRKPEGSIANHGLELALTSATGAVAFDSKEAVNTSHQPELEIAMTGPTGPQGPQGPQGPTRPESLGLKAHSV